MDLHSTNDPSPIPFALSLSKGFPYFQSKRSEGKRFADAMF